MIDLKKLLEDFWNDPGNRFFAGERFVRGIQEASGKDKPTLGDIARLPMEKVAGARGIGRTTLRTLVRFFEDEGIKTRYSWSKEKLKKVRMTHTKTSLRLLGYTYKKG